jgi:hypothetical protein
MSSVILSYNKSLSTFGSPNGTVTLDYPLRWTNKGNTIQKIRLIKATISDRMPNIYSQGTTFNNGLVRVTNDGGLTWTPIQLQNGVYTIPLIQEAINQTIGPTYYTSMSDPGILIQYNLSTNIVYIIIDSSKLAVGTQIGIDFSQSLIYQLLGFVTTKTFITDGTHSASNYAQLDWFGNSVSVVLTGFGPISIKNGALSNELVSIPLSASNVNNEYIYPTAGIISPIIPLSRPISELRNFDVTFLGSRVDSNGVQYPIYILDGMVEIVLELSW